MPNYRRAFIPEGTCFFTVNLLQRHHNDLLIRKIDLLRETVRRVREKYPFQIDAWVVLPEHLHSTAWMQEVEQRRSSCRAYGPCHPETTISVCVGD